MRTVFVLGVMLVTLSPLGAQSVPPLLNYQGQLANATGQPLATGSYDLSFSIYAAPCGSPPCGDVPVWGPQTIAAAVVDGVFNVVLSNDGDGDPVSDAFGEASRYIQVTVDGGAPILPRQQVLSAPFAFVAEALGGSMVTVTPETAVNLRVENAGATKTFDLKVSGSDWPGGLLVSAKNSQTAVDEPIRLQGSELSFVGGRVAVGNVAPQEELHVVGDALLTGNLIVGGQIQQTAQKACYLLAATFAVGPMPVPSSWTKQNCINWGAQMNSYQGAGGFSTHAACIFSNGSFSIANTGSTPNPNCGW